MVLLRVRSKTNPRQPVTEVLGTLGKPRQSIIEVPKTCEKNGNFIVDDTQKEPSVIELYSQCLIALVGCWVKDVSYIS